ncbi:MAG: hypothetical protein NVS9B1_03180 [Candidatus Dormibacteraceae bacterium]
MISSKHSVHIERPVHEVFEYLKDHDNRIHWQGNLVTQEHQKIAKGTKVTEVRNVLGKRVEIEGEITEFEADKKLTFVGKGPHVKRLEYHYKLSPQEGGTRLDTEVDFELSDLMGMAKPIIQKLTDRELDHTQRTLKDILEMPEAHRAANQLPKHTHHK